MNAVNNYHEIRFQYDPRRAVVWTAICSYLQPWVKEDEGLVELGAGYGEFSRNIRAGSKWALDMNPALTQFWGDTISPLIQSATDPLPLQSDSVATVFASNFFEHFTIEQGEQILEEANRVLRPGGRLIVVQPNFRLEPRRYYDDYTHKTAYTDNGFTDFLRSLGWKIVHSEPRFTPFSMKSRIPVAGWLIRLYLALPFRPFAGQFLLIAEKDAVR
jgi:ubiquinone/menaquinone biosynthesis C-methylase UbiE